MKRSVMYTVIVIAAFILVVGGFFMPEISLFVKEQNELLYTYEANKTTYTVRSDYASEYAVTEAMGYTRYFTQADIYYEKIEMTADSVSAVSLEFMNGMPHWRYGCDKTFVSAEPYFCKPEDSPEGRVQWKVMFYSETLKSNLIFIVDDHTAAVVGFYTVSADTFSLYEDYRGKKRVVLSEEYYLNKYIGGLRDYYGWSTTYSISTGNSDGVISYRISFVDKSGGHGSVELYYNYYYGNMIFNMDKNIAEIEYAPSAEYTEPVEYEEW